MGGTLVSPELVNLKRDEGYVQANPKRMVLA
jgi:hypothetical protein